MSTSEVEMSRTLYAKAEKIACGWTSRWEKVACPGLDGGEHSPLCYSLVDTVLPLLRPSPPAPIPMRLTCPACNELHVDVGEFASKPHHTHACQHCGAVWRPSVVHTVGVRFLPGFKDDEPARSP